MTVTMAHVRRSILRDTLTGEYADQIAAYSLNSDFVELYDPPEDGVTPLDGEGKPRTSVVAASQALRALDNGFTEEPVMSKRAEAAAERKAEAAEKEETRAASAAKGVATRKRNATRATRAQAKEAKAVDEASAPAPAHAPVTPVGESENVGDNRFTYGAFAAAPQPEVEGGRE